MLTLNIPDQDAALQHAVETRPKAVADWLGRLPFASPADTAQQLLVALYALNRHPLGGDDRHALLALYRPVIERAAASLESQLADAGVPPQAQQRQLGTLLRELHIEHSIGYKQALLGLANRRFGRASPKRTRTAEVTARLLAALRDIQMACYLTHTPPPAGLWQEMRHIHEFAVTSNLADLAVDDAPAPRTAYIQAVLFALANPPHMTHAERLHTRLYLGQFGTLGTLVAAPVEGHRGFPIAATGDAVPSPHVSSPEQYGHWLDTDALCRHLHETAVRLRTGATPRRIGLPVGMESELSQSLCKRLLKQWSGGTQRAFRRHATPGNTVQVVAGLRAIHRLLDPEQKTPWPDPADADSLLIPEAGRVQATPGPVVFSQWTVDNDSAAGLALSSKPDAPLNLKVGDPLVLKASDVTTWSLGMIRWIRMRDAQQVELGIERLSPQVLPVWVRPLRGHRKAYAEAALFVPGLAALQQKDRMLLPSYLYQIGMDADVWQPPHQYTLTFGRCLEHTPSFDLIDFTLIADEPS